MTIDTEKLYINGINGMTGDPLVNPISAVELETAVRQHYSPEERAIDREISERSFEGPDQKYPEKAGWGLLIHQDDAEYKDLLSELIKHRNGRLFHYMGESPSEWKNKHEVESTQFPRYVLVAGNPAKVPFELQFALTADQRFVGRLDFDKKDDYRKYAENVISSESDATYVKPTKRAVFFAPKHEKDLFEPSGCDILARPLYNELSKSRPAGFQFEPPLFENDATKEKLLNAVKERPGLLFTVSHGIGFPTGETPQREFQGSLQCQDFEPKPTRSYSPGCISGWDVTEGFQIPGGVHFMFACYSMGTRKNSDFLRYVPAKSQETFRLCQGSVDFTAHLPKMLLAQGKALAVIGHIDPAFNYGFISPSHGESRRHPYGLALERLVNGCPVGFAMGGFTERYGSASADLLDSTPQRELTALWIKRNDARNYMILGDPAVRIQFSED